MTTVKKTAPKKAAKKAKVEVVKPAGEYLYAVGRRKRATAKTKLWQTGTGEITINGKPYTEFFPSYEHREICLDALRAVGKDGSVTIIAETIGGGQRGQAEAVRLGISRALLLLNPDFRKTLKAMGFLMRDPREKERKHYGFKKARKASQWAKR
jgi:small subunit ribosomal protein S9